MVNLRRQYTVQNKAARRAFDQHIRGLRELYMEGRRARMHQCTSSGTLVNVNLYSIAKHYGVSQHDISYDYSCDLPLWAKFELAISSASKGSFIMWEPCPPHSEGDASDTDSGVDMPAGPLREFRNTELARMLMTGNSITVWFENAQDATLFKLTWA